MKKKKLKLKFDKKNLIILGSVLAVIIILIIGIAVIPSSLSKNNQEKEFISKLEEMGKEFYEEFYYKQIGSTDEERNTFLQKYTDIGIKVNLDNLSRYSGKDSETILKEFVNKKTKESCDKSKTQVVIYPKEPYKKNSYEMDVKLFCGFDDKK